MGAGRFGCEEDRRSVCLEHQVSGSGADHLDVEVRPLAAEGVPRRDPEAFGTGLVGQVPTTSAASSVSISIASSPWGREGKT